MADMAWAITIMAMHGGGHGTGMQQRFDVVGAGKIPIKELTLVRTKAITDYDADTKKHGG